MPIEVNDAIWKFGTQDAVDDGSTSTIANDAFSVAADVDSAWANDDDAPFGSAVLECQFDTTMPSVGAIGLYARLIDVQSTSDENETDGGFAPHRVGQFDIDFNVAADVNFFTVIDLFRMPQAGPGQIIEWYLKNEGTSQVIGIDWNLWITPKSMGPKA